MLNHPKKPVENSESGARVRSNSVATEKVPCKCPNTNLTAVERPAELNYFGKVQVEIVPEKEALNTVLTDENSVRDMVQELLELLCKYLKRFFILNIRTIITNFSE